MGHEGFRHMTFAREHQFDIGEVVLGAFRLSSFGAIEGIGHVGNRGILGCQDMSFRKD